MKLYELPRNTFIKYTNSAGEIFKILFDHIDGMYSYCTYQENVIHLSASEEVELWDDETDVDYK